MYGFTYDAWNRLTRVSRAYRDSGGTLQPGSTINTIAYDGLGRRISKAVTNSADLNATFHYYYNPGGQSIIETRNGSNQTLKQHVWGLTYIDELVQTSLNDDPADGGEQVCESHYWVMQDANFNVLGVVDSSGVLRERYEYTPYGERKVFTSPGVNDPLCYAPLDISKRWLVSSVAQPYGLCEVGHQGLWHDEETGLVYQRRRMWHPQLGRFIQADPVGYPDGLNRYAGYHILHGTFDPSGLLTPPEFWDEWMPQQRDKWFNNFKKKYGQHIENSAKSNCVPKELLAAVIANELIDYGAVEGFMEKNVGWGGSIGPAQIQPGTLVKDGVLIPEEMKWLQKWDAGTPATIEDYLAGMLMDDASNIDMAGRLVSKYLDHLCSEAKAGNLSQSFQADISAGCNIDDFCCKTKNGDPKSCDEIKNMDVPKCLISSMTAIWNNGKKITGANNIQADSPNAYNHAFNAGLLDNMIYMTPTTPAPTPGLIAPN